MSTSLALAECVYVCLVYLFLLQRVCGSALGTEAAGLGFLHSVFHVDLHHQQFLLTFRQSLIAIVTVRVGLGVNLYDRNFLDVVRARYCESVCDRHVNEYSAVREVTVGSTSRLK